jgi:uncharacterized Fe-S cluster protein YjdI/CDGSH-type Zn-finger protein
MAGKKHTYESDELVVDFDVARCIHAEECVHGSPEAFDATRRPWIDPTLADSGDIARVIQRCPTGALRYRWKTGAEGEQASSTNTVRAEADGPLYVLGRLRLSLTDGEAQEESRLALCRCGHSKNKPFCDNTHRQTGFSDDGVLSETRLGGGARISPQCSSSHWLRTGRSSSADPSKSEAPLGRHPRACRAPFAGADTRP